MVPRWKCFARQGTSPPVQVALDLYAILRESDTDLRQPVCLEHQLLKDDNMDSDVGKSMLQLLQVWHTSPDCNDDDCFHEGY